jgi:phage tail-like protein
MPEEGGNGTDVANQTGTSRRAFLTGAAGLTGVALSVGHWTPALAANVRVVNTGSIGLELDRASAGFIPFAVGGNATSDVVTEKIGSDHIARKHLAGVKYEDITINAGTGMSKAFYSWVASTPAFKFERHNGAIVAADTNFKIRARVEFTNALITEIGMPALDAASKDAAKMTIKFAPEFTRRVTKVGGTLKGSFSAVQQKWNASNFKLSIGGVDTTFVSKIDALVIKANVVENPTGELRDYEKSIASIDVPNLKLTLAESHADDFFKWHEDFVIKGNNSSENEKKGSLSFLAQDLKTELFRLDFTGLGIFALDPDPYTAHADNVRRVTAQVYCETISFSAPNAKV